MSSLWLLLTALTFNSVTCSVSYAGSPKLEIGLSEVKPLAYREGGKFKGINYDILTQLEKESGLSFNYTLYPHARLMYSIENTQSDIAIFFTVNCLKYPSTYEVQTKLHEAYLGVYLKEGAVLTKPSLQIGMIRGTCTRLSAHALKPEMIVEVSNMDQAIEMLKAGRLDGICGIKAVIDASVNSKDLKEKLTLAQRDSEPMEAVICRKKSLPAEVKKKLDEAAKKLKIPPLE